MKSAVKDLATIFGKGLVGAIPFVGPLVAEIIGSIIPNQRIDRIETLLKMFEAKIHGLDREEIEKKLTHPESIDLLEDGFLQASRALSDDRKDYIASLIKNSLTDEQLQHIEYKKVMSLLGQLNDIEVLMLKYHSFLIDDENYQEFIENHEEVIAGPSPIGKPQQVSDGQAIHQSYKTHLASLGLIESNFIIPEKEQFPEFDKKTGMIKANGYLITTLGKLLLKSIDQLDYIEC
jgi:hypothetical protein